MSIPYDDICRCFVDIAKEAVGSQLAEIPLGTGTTPAVIRARQKGPVPPTPYVVFDITSIRKTDGWLMYEGITDDDKTSYETHYKLFLRYNVYGPDALLIAHDLEAYFRLNSVLSKIEDDTTGTLEDTFEVISVPQRGSTEWLDVAFFTITMNVSDYHESEGDGVFDTIELAGEVHRTEDDEDPFLFDVVQTSVEV